MMLGPRTTHSPGWPTGISFMFSSTTRTSINGEGRLRSDGTSPGTAVCEQIARLALPEGVVKIDAEGLGQLRDDVRHHVGVADGEAQARQIVGLPLRVVHEVGDHAGQEQSPAQSLALDALVHGRYIDALECRIGAAGEEGRVE